MYGKGVVENRTAVETAFVEAVNNQLVDDLSIRMINYTAHPSQTPGATGHRLNESSYDHVDVPSAPLAQCVPVD